MRAAGRSVVLLAGLAGLGAEAEAQGAAGWALRFYGNGFGDIDRVKISIDAPPRPADVGVGDFTVEFWMKALLSENGSGPVRPAVPGRNYPSYSGWIEEARISTTLRYTGPFAPPSMPFVPDAATAALYDLDEGTGNLVSDSSGAPGGPSNGVRMFGGNPPGPEWVVSTAPLPVELLSFTVH